MTLRSDERRRAGGDVMAQAGRPFSVADWWKEERENPFPTLKERTDVRFSDLVGKLVYLAGPYTNPNNNHNTRRACEFADGLVAVGIWPIVPHMSHMWDTISPKNYSPDFWYNYDLRLLERCDAMVVIPGSGDSKGVALEREHAAKCGIPVYDWCEL